MVGAQIAIANNSGGFKFGSSVRDCHTYNICKYEIFRQLDHQTAKFKFPAKFSGYTVK